MSFISFLFGEPKLSREELGDCLIYLGEQYKLTIFQEREADRYNNALVKYGVSLLTDSSAAKEMVKVARRLVQSATEVMPRCDNIKVIPETVSDTHFAWRIVFTDYLAWATAQCAAYEAIAEGREPRGDYVASLFKQREDARKKAEKTEKTLLKRMKSSGCNMNDITKLITYATKAVDEDDWQPPHIEDI